MAGLQAARVLADYYTTVTVVERDALPHDPAQRRGVRRAGISTRYCGAAHRSWGSSSRGCSTSSPAAGATVLDDGDLSRASFTFGGHELYRSGKFTDPLAALHYIASRPFLEAHVRRRLRAITNVTILDGHDVAELIAAERDRVTGARVANREPARYMC